MSSSVNATIVESCSEGLEKGGKAEIFSKIVGSKFLSEITAKDRNNIDRRFLHLKKITAKERN